ncbi:MAG: PrsW family glutamic-type intramembrane protease [Polyangiaceae bacterium]|nr:PrsW family glutamic-type intramembrane protease [Polyangiaceae bacterium]
MVLGTALLGAGAGAATLFAQRFVFRLAELDRSAATFGSPIGLLFVLAFSAPIAEASKVAAVWPAFRSRHFNAQYDGILCAVAAATGFAASRSALGVMHDAITIDSILRVEILMIAHPLMSSIWGHALGKVHDTRIPTMRFAVSWTLATMVHGLLLHLTLATSLLALVAAFPVLAGLAFSTWWGARDVLAMYTRTSRISARSILPSLPPPSFRAVRHALRRTERPIHMLWIAIGTFTTTGVALAMVVIAVFAGHKMGFDFSAIERDDTTAMSIAPLVLLTLSVLSAFPISGYLVTKSCDADGILESSVAAILAIAAILVVLALATPVALVFALAFTPIAFGLACTGAWFGLGK